MDVSDTQVFEHAARPGEWAVTGSFSFSDVNIEDLNRKQRLAFKSGWVGIPSGGYSTLVQVTSATQSEFDDVVLQLAQLFVQAYGAPDIDQATPVARDEVLYVSSLCEYDEGTLLSLSRELKEDGIREIVRPVNLDKNSTQAIKIWELIEE